jgi:hypothetical protein
LGQWHRVLFITRGLIEGKATSEDSEISQIAAQKLLSKILNQTGTSLLRNQSEAIWVEHFLLQDVSFALETLCFSISHPYSFWSESLHEIIEDVSVVSSTESIDLFGVSDFLERGRFPER